MFVAPALAVLVAGSVSSAMLALLVVALSVLHTRAGAAWWAGALYYRLHVDSFKDLDGDGLGDLPGASQQLSYVKALGCDAVVLSPLAARSPDCAAPGVTDFAALDPRYGTAGDLAQLVQKAKKLDLKVLVSLDLSTVSTDSEWFQSSASRERGFEEHVVWAEERPDDAQDGLSWVWDERRQGYWAARDNSSLLNLCAAGVGAALAQAQCAWLRRGAAGLLLRPDFSPDADCGVRLLAALAVDAARCARAANADMPVIMVESALGPGAAARYYGEEGAGAHLVLSSVLGPAPGQRGLPAAADLALGLHAALLHAPLDAAVAWLAGPPDEARVATRYGADAVDALNLLALTLPGAAVLRQGDELGAAEAVLAGPPAGGCRPGAPSPAAAPFPWDDTSKGGFTAGEPWLPLAPNYRYANAKTEYANELSHLGVTRAAAALRRTPALGLHVEIKRFGSAVAVLRWGGAGSLLLVGNFGSSATEVPLARVAGLPAQLTAAAGALPLAAHVPTDRALWLGAREAVLLVGAPRHCSGPGPVDKIATKLTEGWQKINKYFGNV